MKIHPSLSLAAFALFITVCGFVKADEFHYNNLLIGDRASGMGGAYTAVSDDATGMYYNPAAIVYSGDRNFSASVNAYFSQSKKYSNVFGDLPFTQTSSALLANYFGIVKPLGDIKVGFSYAVPDSINEDLSQSYSNVSSSVSRFTINLNSMDNTYNIGPSIAAQINNDLAVGLTLYLHQRNALLVLNQFQEMANSAEYWSNSYFRMSETGIRPILGVSWSPVEKLALGFSLTQTIVLSSNASLQKTCWGTVAGSCVNSATAPSIQTPTFSSTDIKRKYPTRITVGAAYFADKDFLISGDWSYNTAVSDPVFGDKVATFNGAIGTEYYLSRKWAIRAGAFTNMANTPNIIAGVTKIQEHIDLYGLSLSLTNFSNTSSLTIGGSISYGTGQAQILNDTSVQNATTSSWMMFLSSTY